MRFCLSCPFTFSVQSANYIFLFQLFSSFLLARLEQKQPRMELWPPSTIPSQQWVQSASENQFRDPFRDPRRQTLTQSEMEPLRRSEMSNQAFRIKKWMEMLGNNGRTGTHIGEEVETYGTLDPRLYTPTADKPWRGIWVGDYSGHGCEFLLMHQPDDIAPFDESLMIQGQYETPDDFAARKKDERLYHGSLTAIKLTGDPHIPRGEITFMVDDLSKKIRVATADPFKGARLVRSLGHVAASNFQEGESS